MHESCEYWHVAASTYVPLTPAAQGQSYLDRRDNINYVGYLSRKKKKNRRVISE